jgi:aminopeptidase N
VQHLIEAQTHRDLEWFFDDWVYRDRGLPDFRVESAYPRATVDGSYVVTVTIENLGDAGAEVPVTLRMQDGEVTKRLEVHAKSKASIRIEASSTPQEVMVNDGGVPESGVSNNVFKVQPPDAAK